MPTTNAMRRLALVFGIVFALLAGTAVTVAVSKQAIAAPVAYYQTTTDVSARLSPTAAPGAGYGAPAWSTFGVECQVIGEPVGVLGNDLYFLADYQNSTFFIPDTWTTSPHQAGQPPLEGIPMCGNGSLQGGTVTLQGSSPCLQGSGCTSDAQPVAPTPSREQQVQASVMQWARSYINADYYYDLCLQFVFDAYQQAGVDLRNEVDIPITGDSYPIDLLGHITAGTMGTGTPPPGALIIYTSYYGPDYSHVTISLGGGNSVSTADALNGLVHYETTAQHSYAASMTWWLPAT